MFGSKQTNYEAVLFVSHNKVLKEMLYSEFEAVLDGVVTEPAFCGQTCHAVFLKIDTRLNILGMVFFIIDFDEQGGADRRWNLPLGQMLDHAPANHTLNGCAIRVSCRSQCSIAAQQEYLWEPNLTAEGSVLPMLASCVKANRLGLLVDSSASAESEAQPEMPNAAAQAAQFATGAAYQQVVGEQAEHEEKVQKMAANLKKQQLYIASLKARSEQDIESMRSQFSREKEALLLQLEEACSTLKSASTLNRKLEQELDELRTSGDQQRELLEKQLSANTNQQGVDFFALQKQFRRELQEKLLEQTSELKARLEMRDVEVHYRDQQIKSLKQQLADAANGNHTPGQELAGDYAWQEEVAGLEQQGVNFMLALPAMRPLNIPAAEVAAFRREPENYVAAKLGVEPALYQAWLLYSRNPVCVEQVTEDCQCGARLEIVRPSEFIPDVSNRCPDHRDNLVEKLNLGR